ncbi:HNH endonuclease signature motif containing protein [Occultella glacieicola]|nr:HNH endonuclease signature motif containing protein [Occultella glacieicola]
MDWTTGHTSGEGSPEGGGAQPADLATDPRRDAALADLLTGSLDDRLYVLDAVTAALADVDRLQEQHDHTGRALGEASVRAHRDVEILTGRRLDWLAAEKAEGMWDLSGRVRTYTQHVARTHKMSFARASREVRLAERLCNDLPEAREAIRRGDLGVEQAALISSVAASSAARRAALRLPARGLSQGSDAEPSQPGEAADSTSTGTEAGAAGATGEASFDDDATAESVILHLASTGSFEDLRVVCKYFAALSDAESDERGYKEACEREFLDLAATTGGFHLSGFLTDEHGQLVKQALAALTPVPAADDTRTASQRRAQALADGAQLILNQGLAGKGQSVRPHMGVLISAPEFEHIVATSARHGWGGGDATSVRDSAIPDWARAADACDARPEFGRDLPPLRPGTGGLTNLKALENVDWHAILSQPPATWADGTGPVPPSVLRRIACGGEIYRIIFGPDSEVINVGRVHRRFTSAQRRAMIARDRHCTYPGCTAPPALCEGHHANVHWAAGGNTDLPNGALLCFYHHRFVDTRQIAMVWEGNQWVFYTADGDRIGPGP